MIRRFLSPDNQVANFCTLFIGLVGLVVMAGWILRVPAIIQLVPNTSPMSFNAAVGLVVAALGLHGVGTRSIVTRAAGSVLLVLGGLTMAEYMFGRNLGIDQLLQRDWFGTDIPGRMGLNTAACFTTVGISYLLSRTRGRADSVIVLVAAVVVLSVSSAALLGYAIGLEFTYRWGAASGMALPTAMALFVLSAGLFDSGRRHLARGRQAWLAVGAGSCMLGITLILSLGTAAQQHHATAVELETAAASVARLTMNRLANLQAALIRLDDRWSAGCGQPCRDDVAAYLRDFPELTRAGWVHATTGSVAFFRRRSERESLIEPEDRVVAAGLARRASERLLSQGSTMVVFSVPASRPELILGSRRSGSPSVFLATADPALLLQQTIAGDSARQVRLTIDGNEVTSSPALNVSAGVGTFDGELEGSVWRFTVDRGAVSREYLADLLLLGGVLISCFVSTTVLLWQSNRERLLSATRDISERKRLEQKAHEINAALAAANQAKSSFLATMSHEIRTPMNAILGMADLLWESPLDSTQRQYVEICRRNGHTLLVLINDILDLSKIEAGRFALERVEFSLDDVIREALELIATPARTKGLTLTLDRESGTASSLLGDPLRLRQVLVNLLGNAVKFTDRGGIRLVVSTPTTGIPGTIAFAVTDTGPGIPPELLDRIFADFAQADSSATRKYGGTGMGLGISRRLVEMMGGRLEVTSTVGQGSTFTFSGVFEVSRSDRVPLEVVNLEGSRPGLSILVAEDSADNRVLVDAYLKGLAHALTFAEDGRQAVESFMNGRFDLVLMDVQMPVMDGLEATRTIRAFEAREARAPIPIVAVTASAHLEDIEASHLAGCNEHLSKPISKRALLDAIQRLTGDDAGARQLRDERWGRIEVPEGLEELIPEYLESCQGAVEQAAALLLLDDFDGVRRLAHKMAGSGGSYGFRLVSQLGASLEQSARAGDKHASEAFLGNLRDYLAHVNVTTAQ